MNDIISDLPTGEELLDKERIAEEEAAVKWLNALRLFATDKFDKPEFTLYQGPVGFAPLGNIMAICAEMKNGKTWLMLILAVAVLKGEYMGLHSDMKDSTVLWFDTEQDKYDTQLIMRRVHQLCGWDYNIDNPRFVIFNLRSIRYEERKKAVLKAIELFKPTVVFLDGIRDLIESFNNEDDSFNLISDFMKITEEAHCCIWSVLHVNPNSDKMRGHLGTELGNKTTDVFNVKKEKNHTTGEITFEVEQVAARHRDIDGWKFRIDDNPVYAVPVQLSANEVKSYDTEKRNELINLMSKYCPELAAISQTALRDKIKAGEGMGSTKAWNKVQEAIGAGILEKVIGGKFRMRAECRKSEKPFGEPDNDIPF